MAADVKPISIDPGELHGLLIVARMYLDAFGPDERISMTEAIALEDLEAVVDHYYDLLIERGWLADDPRRPVPGLQSG